MGSLSSLQKPEVLKLIILIFHVFYLTNSSMWNLITHLQIILFQIAGTQFQVEDRNSPPSPKGYDNGEFFLLYSRSFTSLSFFGCWLMNLWNIWGISNWTLSTHFVNVYPKIMTINKYFYKKIILKIFFRNCRFEICQEWNENQS